MSGDFNMPLYRRLFNWPEMISSLPASGRQKASWLTHINRNIYMQDNEKAARARFIADKILEMAAELQQVIYGDSPDRTLRLVRGGLSPENSENTADLPLAGRKDKLNGV